jgi:hypothetical protein
MSVYVEIDCSFNITVLSDYSLVAYVCSLFCHPDERKSTTDVCYNYNQWLRDNISDTSYHFEWRQEEGVWMGSKVNAIITEVCFYNERDAMLFKLVNG